MDDKRPLNVFVSASAKDAASRDALMVHLASLENRLVIQAWHAGRIPFGGNVRAEAAAALGQADVVLVLLSAHYLAGIEIETPPGRIEQERKTWPALRVVPVPLAPCGWKNDPFLKDLAPLPAGGTPVSKHADPDEAWNEIAEALGAMAMQPRPARPIPDSPSGSVPQPNAGERVHGSGRWGLVAAGPVVLGILIAALIGQSPHTNTPPDMALHNQPDLSPPPPVIVQFRSNQSKVRIRLPDAPAPLCETLPCEVPWAPGQPLQVTAERDGYPPQTITRPNPEQAMREGGVDVYFGVPAPVQPGSTRGPR